MKSTLSLTSEVICTRQPYSQSLFVSRFFAFSNHFQSGQTGFTIQLSGTANVIPRFRFSRCVATRSTSESAVLT